MIRAGRLAGHAVETAVKLALQGEVDAIVTAPAHKHALHLAGFPYPGHTEWLAKLAGDVDVAMMLASPELRVVLVTTHVPFRDVPALLTVDRVTRTGRITQHALREWFGIASPRLAVCAVNPHAGESGLFGDEEQRVLRPAAEALGATGPLPADTVFVRALRGEFDAVLAPYHDVGMTAIKVASFGRAVNVTLGLPFPRTSPDHGTALDIAGTGTADASSMRAAIELALKLGARPPSRDISPRYASSLSFCDARFATSTAPHCSTVSRSTSPIRPRVFPVSTRSTIQCDKLSSGATSTEPFTWMMSTGRPAAPKCAWARRGYLVATRAVIPPGRAGYGASAGVATTSRQKPKPSSSGSSTSAPVSRRTSVPVTPRSAAPDST